MNVVNKSNVFISKKVPKIKPSLEKWRTYKIIFQVFLVITCFKILLIPTYRSTDFEVHRNWLAITHNLPINEWYVNTKSQWTLDYPPLFAWFEYFLSHVARLADSEMLKVENLNYASRTTILFQRGSVIFLDIVFAYGVKNIGEQFCTTFQDYSIFVILSLCNIGLIVVDHIHFQYNGFLLGILQLAITNVSKINKQLSILQGTLWFALLLNLKHIYLYVAPVFAIWLFRSYCMNGRSFCKRFFLLGIIVTITFIGSFGPFISQMPQVLSRLFPFKRGLVHSYWAANFWALYVGLDKGIAIILKRLGWLKIYKSAVMTGGLVQEQSFIVLPTPTPLLTLFLTVLSMMPVLYCLLFKKKYSTNPKQFVRSLILCALCSFMFGWHVHEKAILTSIIPLCVLAVNNKKDARIFLILSSAGHTALLPLLYLNNLTPLKILLLLIYMIVSFLTFLEKYKQHLLHSHEYVYVMGLPLLTIYETILHKLIFGVKLPFLPLAVCSVYCAVGIFYSWILYYRIFLQHHNEFEDTKDKET